MIRLHETTESTNDLALEAADEAPHGTCWVADRQIAGRGRRELGGDRRPWFSPERANIYLSCLLRPDLPPAEATHMTLAAAVGAADALVEETGVDIWIKWPNDLFVGDRKVGGILTEAHTEAGELSAVVVGLGINVNVPSADVPAELESIMTSLRIEAGRDWDRLSLIFELRNGVVDRCEEFSRTGLEGIADDLQAYDRTTGRKVEIRQNENWAPGVAKGIGRNGHLVVELDGREVEIQAGEVRFPEL